MVELGVLFPFEQCQASQFNPTLAYMLTWANTDLLISVHQERHETNIDGLSPFP